MRSSTTQTNPPKPLRSLLVIGAAGMLGTELVRQLQKNNWLGQTKPPAVLAYDINEIDITKPQSVAQCFDKANPEVVINCAAVTDVDGCEANPEPAFAVNAGGAEILARACQGRNCKLVHISTDFVFDGSADQPYLPEDKPNPLSIYGQSKFQGEENIRANLKQHLIVRTSWLFGQNGKNFVATIARAAQQKPSLQVVHDQVGCPTYTVDLAQALLCLIAIGATGTLHFRNEGQCSWFQFAQEIVAQMELKTEVQPITSQQLNRPAPRPAYSVLDIGCCRSIIGRNVRTWQNAVKHYLAAEGFLPVTPPS